MDPSAESDRRCCCSSDAFFFSARQAATVVKVCLVVAAIASMVLFPLLLSGKFKPWQEAVIALSTQGALAFTAVFYDSYVNGAEYLCNKTAEKMKGWFKCCQ